MNLPSIRIEGAILSPDALSHLDDDNTRGQRPTDFGLPHDTLLKDEIARAWADAQDYWRIYQRKLSSISPENKSFATTETRNNWIVPLLGLLGYKLERQNAGPVLNGKTYPFSHTATDRGGMPVHIIGSLNPSGLDRKPTQNNGPRMSAHAMVQEYLNLTDQLYAIISDGHVLRLLRDSSRLVKLTYLEFDLDRIFTDGLFSDFALLYRLIHASRFPSRQDELSECIFEFYHQNSIEAGARIRHGLSGAVKSALLDFANGLLTHPKNSKLRDAIQNKTLSPDEFYQNLLRLIYRILFLVVIEERNLVYPLSPSQTKRDLYYQYYSIQRIRRLSEKHYLIDNRHDDAWIALLTSFCLFEANGPGEKMGIAPLAGDLFRDDAIGLIRGCILDNATTYKCLRSLSLYQNSEFKQTIRVNYAALNVEEFGSVYEGLLEYQPTFEFINDSISFQFAKGEERSSTGSHYTPDDLVQPLLKHSLDHLIDRKLKESDKESALLSLRIADISCGSGHILLAAARRIATALATARTGEEQPSPATFRIAVRDVIRHCIYGVDLNPLAVELCKVALWLEAHVPGQPLNFLDHHIKCGNAIVGFVKENELDRGIPNEAFSANSGDDKLVASALRKRNKQEHSQQNQTLLPLAPDLQEKLDAILKHTQEITSLPERTPDEIEQKRARYQTLRSGENAWLMEQIASIPIAQFYIPKIESNKSSIILNEEFRAFRNGRTPQGIATATAWDISNKKRFFHWFLHFPEIIKAGGFDCILGNPPYLGGQAISGKYGYAFCQYVKWEYAPAGLSDLVVYFVRRIYSLLKSDGFAAFITTNSIKDGDVRKDGLEQILSEGGSINFVVRGTKWPGAANLVVSLLSLYRGKWEGKFILDNKEVSTINAFFENSDINNDLESLFENKNRMFQGSIFLGEGFLLSHPEAKQLCNIDNRNEEVIFPIINGVELNNQPDQQPGRSIINFRDWPIERARRYTAPFRIIEEKVKPFRASQKRKRNRDFWWIYAEHRPGLSKALSTHSSCFVAARTTKHLSFSTSPTDRIFSDAVYVFTTDRWDLFSIVQSTIHEIWARKYSGSLETRLRYSPSDCFETFAFPPGLWKNNNQSLIDIGKEYHDYRRKLMLQLWLGLTDIYNLFHDSNLTPESVAHVSKKPSEANTGYEGIIQLRSLHRKLDKTVLSAYGWLDEVPLAHDFYEIETLPEKDRIRYTINPTARIELLKRLLLLNHTRASDEKSKENLAVTHKKKSRTNKFKKSDSSEELDLFGSALAQQDIDLPTYPTTSADSLICALTLEMLEWESDLPARNHLDALILLSNEKLSGALLPQGLTLENKKLLQTITSLYATLKQDGIKWSQALQYLEAREAIIIQREKEHILHRGISFSEVRKTIKQPSNAAAIAALLLTGVGQLNELRKRHNLSIEQQTALTRFEETFSKIYTLV